MTPTATAHCHGCDWTAEGIPDDTDKAAEKHAGPGHPTGIVVRWAAA
jgi:hypothetical protein